MNKFSKKGKGKKYFTKYYKANTKKERRNISLDEERQDELTDLQKKIKEINLVLLDFQFKKTTRQPIKPHEIKIAKKERARLITRYWELYSGQELSLQT